MARNLFISVLGSGNYSPCHYIFPSENYKSKSIKYVQEATLEMLKPVFKENDSICILVTKGDNGSCEKNWQSCSSNQGLKERLDLLQLPCNIKSVEIARGDNEKEIWSIFSSIFNEIKEDDHIFFDITHEFRYLPMLGLVLLNYSKFLKNIAVEQITYGNFEGRNVQTNEAEIIDLTSFSILQDWTNAASEFFTTGSAQQLKRILEKSKSNLIVKKEKDYIRNFKNSLDNFLAIIKNVRGKRIYSGKEAKDLYSNIQLLSKRNSQPALEPIIKEIEKKITPFTLDDNHLKAKAAIDWCIENGMIQQAYTLGQEHIINLICNHFNIDIQNKNHRIAVSKSLGFLYSLKDKKNEGKEPDAFLKLHTEIFEIILQSELVREILGDYSILTNYRNSLNHGGFTSNDNPSVIIQNFENCYHRIIKKIISYN